MALTLQRQLFPAWQKCLLATWLVTFLWAGAAGATSVVCVRTPDALAIAADSMLTIRNDQGTLISSSECKVARAGKVFFALSGFYKDPARDYDVIAKVRAAISDRSGFPEKAAAVSVAVSDALTAELGRLKSEAPAAYNDMTLRGGTLLNLLLAGFEDGSARVSLLKFRQVVSPAGAIALTTEQNACPGNCNAGNISAYYLTDKGPIDAYLKKGQPVDWRSPETAAKFLVQLVLDARTPGVGGPIDVLRIDKSGASWIEHKEQCPELPAPTSEFRPGEL